MKLIVNVEDVGLHPAVTRAVEILAEKGVVTAASIVPTGLDVEGAARLKGVSLGIHLDILRGRPLSHWQGVNSIVDENGMFLNNPVALFEKYAMGKVDHSQVEKEWAAQIERVLDAGVKATHLTSYKHLHAWPSLTRMAADLAEQYGIGWVRKPEDCSEISRLDKSGYQSKFLNVCGLFDRETGGVSWTDVFWGGDEETEGLTPDGFAQYLESCGNVEDDAMIEISCCPGVTVAGDPPIPIECNPPEISSVWRRHFRALAEEPWLESFEKMGLELTGYPVDQ